MNNNLCDIYFIQNEQGYIKIGHSIKVEERKKELQTANSDDLKIKYIIKDITPTFETYLHLICQRFHIQGEWYYPACIAFLFGHEFYKKNMLSYK